MLLGHNLASHFNLEKIKIAEQNDVYFAMLPPNATHLLQPLEICFFIDQGIVEQNSARIEKRLEQKEVLTVFAISFKTTGQLVIGINEMQSGI